MTGPLHRLGLGLILVATVSAFTGCQQESPRPNLLLITLDTTRADRIGAYGAASAQTPNLDALAHDGVTFTHAFASNAVTLPSHATMLTGVEPYRHGVRDNGHFVLGEEAVTVAETLREAGYATGAFVAAFVLDGYFGLDQGFDVYDDSIEIDPDALAPFVPSRQGFEITDAALAWIDRRDGPWFAWAHYYDAHLPHTPPPPFDEFEDSYDGAISYMDQQVGRLLDGIARRDNGRRTLIVAVADHGEALGEHGETTHGILAYDATLRVPLIVSGPGFARDQSSGVFARTVDIAPTLLAAAGATTASTKTPNPTDGRALQHLTEDLDYNVNGDPTLGWFEAPTARHSYGWLPIGGLRNARWKYTATPSPQELYDTRVDRTETTDLASERPEIVTKLHSLYSKISSARSDSGLAQIPAPDVQAKLEALGYVAGPIATKSTKAADPRRAVEALALVDRASGLLREGRTADGLGALEILAASQVARIPALRALGQAYMVMGRPNDAARAFREQYELLGGTTLAVSLARALSLSDRHEEALAILEDTADDSPTGLIERAAALLGLGRHKEAAPLAAQVLATHPGDDRATALLALARARETGPRAQIAPLAESLARSPSEEASSERRLALARLQHWLGRDREALKTLDRGPATKVRESLAMAAIFESRGDLPRAIRIFEETVQQRPSHLGVWSELARLYRESNQIDPAIDAYGAIIDLGGPDASAFADRGALLAGSGRFERAAADYREAIRQNPGLAEPHFNLALVEIARGRSDAAEAALREAIRLRPDYRKAHFHLARIYSQREDPRADRHAALATVGEDQEPRPENRASKAKPPKKNTP